MAVEAADHLTSGHVLLFNQKRVFTKSVDDHTRTPPSRRKLLGSVWMRLWQPVPDSVTESVLLVAWLWNRSCSSIVVVWIWIVLLLVDVLLRLGCQVHPLFDQNAEIVG